MKTWLKGGLIGLLILNIFFLSGCIPSDIPPVTLFTTGLVPAIVIWAFSIIFIFIGRAIKKKVGKKFLINPPITFISILVLSILLHFLIPWPILVIVGAIILAMVLGYSCEKTSHAILWMLLFVIIWDLLYVLSVHNLVPKFLNIYD